MILLIKKNMLQFIEPLLLWLLFLSQYKITIKSGKKSSKTQQLITISQVKVYHFIGAQLLGGFYRSLQARPADVNILRVAVVGQDFQEGADVQVVIIIDVTEPPATHAADREKKRLHVWACLPVWVCEQQLLLLAGADESVIFQSHLTGEGLTGVGRRAVCVDQVTSWLTVARQNPYECLRQND